MTDKPNEEREQRSGKDRRAIPPMSQIIVQDHSKWLMGIVAAVLGGILLGWYNDVREMKPEVASIKTDVSNIKDQMQRMNQQIENLTTVLIRREIREDSRK